MAVTDLTITAETTSNLVDWSTAGVTLALTGNTDADTTEFRAGIAITPGNPQFLRLRVVEP